MRRYRMRSGNMTYEADTRGMSELMVSTGIGSVTAEAAEYGARQLRAGGRGYADVTTERLTYTIFGEPRACAAIYNATPGGLAADARQGLFAQVVSSIEGAYS